MRIKPLLVQICWDAWAWFCDQKVHVAWVIATLGVWATVAWAVNNFPDMSVDRTWVLNDNVLTVTGASSMSTTGAVNNQIGGAYTNQATGALMSSYVGASTMSVTGAFALPIAGNFTNLINGSMSQNIGGHFNRYMSGTMTDTVLGGFYRTISGSMSQVIAGNIDISGVKYTGAFAGIHALSVSSYSMATGANRLFSQDTAGAIQLFGTSANVSMISGGSIDLRPDGNLRILPGSNGDLVLSNQLTVGASTSPRSSTIAEFVSTTAGLLPPRMTGTERDNISNPSTALLIYNTTTNKLNQYTGSAWEEISSQAATWFVDGNIYSGGSNAALSLASSIAAYTPVSYSSLALTNNTSLGSDSSLKIACDTTEAPSGTTCTGNETLGVSFVVPSTGAYRCCFEFMHEAVTPSSSSGYVIFQLISTNSQTTTSSAQGLSRYGTRVGGGQTTSFPINLCGNFSFTSNISDLQVVRVYYEQLISTSGGNWTTNQISTDITGTVGQRDAHVFCHKVQ